MNQDRLFILYNEISIHVNITLDGHGDVSFQIKSTLFSDNKPLTVKIDEPAALVSGRVLACSIWNEIGNKLISDRISIGFRM